MWTKQIYIKVYSSSKVSPHWSDTTTSPFLSSINPTYHQSIEHIIRIFFQGIPHLYPYLPLGLTQAHHSYSLTSMKMITTKKYFLTSLHSNVNQFIKRSSQNTCNGILWKMFSLIYYFHPNDCQYIKHSNKNARYYPLRSISAHWADTITSFLLKTINTNDKNYRWFSYIPLLKCSSINQMQY